MPRTSAVECRGCPPLRVLTTDMLGLVKVVEAHGKAGTPKVVNTWGPPDASRSVLAASYADRKSNPILAVARKNGFVDFLNPLNGEALATTRVDESSSSNCVLQDDQVIGMHLFNTKGNGSSSRSELLLACNEKGKACLKSIPMSDEPENMPANSSSTWNVCNAGKVICTKVGGSESYALFGGKGIEVNLWDLGNITKVWTAKPPHSDSIGIFTPTWFTTATFLSKEDHRKIVTGTNSHKIHLYDTSAQRRPVISVDFRESPIKVVTEDSDGYTVYVGTGSADLASFDMRIGKLLGCYVGKCCGSIRSIAKHPHLPIIASCGLDSYVRFWDTKTRQLLSAVFLKQHLTNVVIDSHFPDTEFIIADQSSDLQTSNDFKAEEQEEQEEEEKEKFHLSDRSKQTKGNGLRKIKKKKSKMKAQDYERNEVTAASVDDGELPHSKRRSPLEEQTRKLKPKKSKKSLL